MEIDQSALLEALASINEGFSGAYLILRNGGVSKKQARSFIQGVLDGVPDRRYRLEEEMLGSEHGHGTKRNQPSGFGFSS